MIEYKPIHQLEDIITFWNQEIGFIYPIAHDVFLRNVIRYEPKMVLGAYIEESLVGFIIAKKCQDELLPEQMNLGWISLFWVAKKARRQGIGTHLLQAAETYLSDKQEIKIGADIHNFFPGVPSDFDHLTDEWLIKRGYTSYRTTHDLINTTPFELPLRNRSFHFSVATKEDEAGIVELLKTFSNRWAHQGIRYFEAGGDGREYVIAKDKGKVIAFARINDRSTDAEGYSITWYPRFVNLGGIGPLGVLADYRHIGLGYDIVAYAIKEMIHRGMIELIIDWTGLVTFYQQFGFEVWKTYQYMSKKA